MKKWLKWLLIDMMVVALILGGIAWHYQNELQAVFYHICYSEEEQEAMKEEEEKHLEGLLEDANVPTELMQGDLTEEEIKHIVDESNKSNKPAGNGSDGNSNGNGGHSQGGGSHAGYDPVLTSMVGEVYGLEARYTGKLNGLLAQAKGEYLALSPSEQESQKNHLISKYAGKAGAMETECDGKMNNVLSRMQSHLKKTGGDTAIVKEIRATYNNKKAMAKSYYISQAY